MSGRVTGLPARILACESAEEMRALGPLPDEAQRQIDEAIVRVGLERLVFVDDLLTEGLIYRIDDPIGTMEVYSEREAEVGHAMRTMLLSSRGENQGADRSSVRHPVYATWDDFQMNIRTLRASRKARGTSIDVSGVEQATRRVNEAIEDAGINGAGISVTGNTTPGLLDAPNAGTQAYIDTEAWTHANHSGQDILDDVLNMIGVAQADNFFGPFNLYVPTTYGNELNKNFGDGVTTFDITIRQRLEQVEAGGRNVRVRVADRLPVDRTSLVQMTSNVVDVIVGMEPTLVSWESGDGFDQFFLVMAFIIPRIRDTYDSTSGIVNGNTS